MIEKSMREAILGLWRSVGTLRRQYGVRVCVADPGHGAGIDSSSVRCPLIRGVGGKIAAQACTSWGSRRKGRWRGPISVIRRWSRYGYGANFQPFRKKQNMWAHLKHHKIGKVAITGPDRMKQHVISFLRSLQKTPALVRAMFQHSSVRYAA
jgi:hypothetical protein